MKHKKFFINVIEKISKNKDIISLMISSSVLFQVILFTLIKKDIRVFFIENYSNLIAFIVFFNVLVFIGTLLYINSDIHKKTSEEFEEICSLKCSKKDSLLINTEEYRERMQIFLLSDIEKIEKQINGNDEIWVLTSDIKLETTVSSISSIIESNLKKGVTYRYFIPETERNNASFLELQRKYNKYENFEIVKISKQYKLLFEKFDVIIYSPDKNYTEGRVGFICVNFSDDEKHIMFKKFSEEDVITLVGRLQGIRSNQYV